MVVQPENALLRACMHARTHVSTRAHRGQVTKVVLNYLSEKYNDKKCNDINFAFGLQAKATFWKISRLIKGLRRNGV